MKVYEAPMALPLERVDGVVPNSIFLAGSIEMGKAEDWQREITKKLFYNNRYQHVFNPRRNDWDSSWEQSIENDNFREQVEWEHLGMEIASTVFFNFCEDTKSPITLMELGMMAHTKKCVVRCPSGFWRKGNVDILCHSHKINVFDERTSLSEIGSMI